MAPLPPSVYISRLRRAFFLRVHPDRFRSHDATVRQKQARLVQALNDRMSWRDFIEYNYGNTNNSNHGDHHHHNSNNLPSKLEYVLEHRDGSLLHQTIQLDESVENILRSMNQSIKDSGAASMPPPPKVQSQQTNNRKDQSVSSSDDTIFWAKNNNSNGQNGQSANNYHQNGDIIDHRFDINTTKGRDLLAFCQSLDRQQVEERRQSRMDANAAAMIGRRLYSFQSIDGTALHWSSKSFAILLHSLISLQEEHHEKFKVDSFYPLRLVFSYNDYSYEESLDLYGGVLYLHPGYTPLQWLEVLREVTPERLETLMEHRGNLDQAQDKIRSALGCKLTKGFTCDGEAFYHFVMNLARHLPDQGTSSADGVPATTTSAVALESIQVTVESSDACRFRCIVTKEGNIRVGALMSADKVLQAIIKDSETARQRRDRDRREREIGMIMAKQVQWELGLTRKVYKAGTFRISHEDFQQCLQRIVNLESDQKGRLKLSLGGNALGVAGSGQFCQLGDDGAVIIPHDWAISGTEAANNATFG